MELKMINNKTGYLSNAVNIGVYISGKNVILIDSGLDRQTAKRVEKIMVENDLTVDSIINTHSHADHMGGNNYLTSIYNCNIIASAGESPMVVNTLIEPLIFFGAYPPKDMRNKFLQAEPSHIDRVIILEDEEIQVDDEKLDIISLKGHSTDMIGIGTKDGVLFIGDSLFTERVIEKYPLMYIYNLEEVYNTLDKLKTLEYDHYVLSHGGVYDDITELIKINFDAHERVNDLVLDIIKSGPKNLIEIHKILGKELGLKENLGNYYLNQSVISAHMTYLNDRGEIDYIIDDGELLWVETKQI